VTRQSAFSFDWPVDLRPENYIVSNANRLAFEAVTRPHDWPFFCTVLQGGTASGKTHLTHIFAAQTGAVLIDEHNLGQAHWQLHRAYAVDDADRLIGQIQAEEALFHLYNAAKANNDRLFITLTQPVDSLPFILPDLKSRLLGATLVTVDFPDEDILSALYTKSFSDRQILVKPDVVAYLVTHAERSFASVQQLVQTIDQWTLATGKPVTIPNIKKILETVSTGEKT
jgi:chromosomal replication initiation ATPase DnaA